MDSRLEQALVRVDIPDAYDHARVHQQLLDSDFAAARNAVEELGRKLIAERLHAQPREQRMPRRVAAGPNDDAETPRVAQTQGRTAEDQVQVIVLAGS